ncbi:PI-PLC domain-containing protein [Saccharothrix sp. S26]|uniref:PI-PLC domain-containing protein n=1 Tax=Saccharothrix sp. S26 TaxID=2907215 RepID=UPI001F3DC987|nr:PI-PLC domain-containing protein [Saccharothrix sp. S26]MCE6994007.1 PI-PLC domain-containing protein [Saccharothrix sp. S26]
MRATRPALIAALVAALTTPLTAQAAPADGLYYVQSATTGLNAGVSGTSVLQRRPKGDEDHQQWTLSGRTLREGAQCLGRSGDQAVMVACGSADAQWDVLPDGDRHRLKVPGSDRYLIASGTDQVRIGTGADLWYLTPVSPRRTPVPPEGQRRLDQVTFLTAHNAYANGVDGGFAPPLVNLAPNQARGIEQQLRDGVRGFQLDVHQTPDGAILCHNSCTWVSRPVALWVDVQRIVDFLGRNPGEFVTIFLEDYAPAELLRAELGRVTGLEDVLFRPDRAGVRTHGWPTLDALRAANDRLLIFTDHGRSGDAVPRDSFGVMYQPEWTVENHWSMGPGLGASDWSCHSRWSTPLTRTEPGFRPLFVMNHFRDVPVTATATTDNGKLADRARRFCEPAARKTPTYLAVDHYHLGDPMAAVAALSTERF